MVIFVVKLGRYWGRCCFALYPLSCVWTDEMWGDGTSLQTATFFV